MLLRVLFFRFVAFIIASLGALIQAREAQVCQASAKVIPQPLIVFNATGKALEAYGNATARAYSHFRDELVSNVTVETATFNNTYRALAGFKDKVYVYDGVSSLLSSLGSSDQQVAANDASSLVTDLDIGLYGNETVFALFDTVRRQNSSALRTEDRRLIEKYYNSFVSAGVAIPAGAHREKYIAVSAATRSRITPPLTTCNV